MSELIAFISGAVMIMITWYYSSNDDKRQYRIGYRDGYEDGYNEGLNDAKFKGGE